MEQTLQDRIRERAYHLWNNGCGQGDDHYWLMAEREVLAEIAAGICCWPRRLRKPCSRCRPHRRRQPLCPQRAPRPRPRRRS